MQKARTHNINNKPAAILLPFIIATLMASWAVGGCSRRPLHVYGSDSAIVRADIDWSAASEHPSGMTFMLFPPESEAGSAESDISNEVEAVYMRLPMGDYRCYAFSYTPSEYGSLTFSDLSDFSRARVTLTGDAPEPISSAAGSFSVTREIIEASRDYVPWQKGMPGVEEGRIDDATRSGPSSLFTTKSDAYSVITLSPADITSSLTVRVWIRNIESLRSVSGSISGMAEGYYLTRQVPTEGALTQPLSGWTAYRSPARYTDGYIETTILTFGLPGTDSRSASRASTGRAPESNILTISLQLRDGTSLDPMEFPVGDLFETSAITTGTGGVSVRLEMSVTLGTEGDEPIILPDVVPDDPEHTGAFDASVEEWEDGAPIEIPL